MTREWQTNDSLCNGKYTIKATLGEGGFGITYLAVTQTEKQVVIKTLKQSVQEHPLYNKLRQDFLNEALRLAQCRKHPHIVKVIELIEENEQPCIVMEYIKGEDLDKIARRQPISESQAIDYITQIGSALSFIHEQGLLHRDVKPQNIVIDEATEKAVLIDFGIAREFDFNHQIVLTSFFANGFSPIEQYDCDQKQGPYTDVYALAATLYFLLTRKTPRSAQNRYYQIMENGEDLLIPLY